MLSATCKVAIEGATPEAPDGLVPFRTLTVAEDEIYPGGIVPVIRCLRVDRCVFKL